jgi:hemin uptake protein HemP
LKEIDNNTLRLSPIRFQKLQSPIKQSPPKELSVKSPVKQQGSNGINSRTQAEHIQDEAGSKYSESSEDDEFVDSPERMDLDIKVTEELGKEQGQLSPPSLHATPELKFDQANDSKAAEEEEKEGGEEESPFFQLKRLPPTNENENLDYDASIEENSFQAIKTAIRKSIINKSKPSEDRADSSFKSATEGERDASPPTTNVSKSFDNSEDKREPSFEEAVKIPLKDASKSAETGEAVQNEAEESRHTKLSDTPPQYSHRESQGFALLPHRGPLTVKSAKKKDDTFTSRKSLFDEIPTYPIRKKSNDSTSQIATSLYPTLNLVDKVEYSSAPTSKTSPLFKSKIQSPRKPGTALEPSNFSKPTDQQLVPLDLPLSTDSKKPTLIPTKLESPTKKARLESPTKKAISPIKNHSPLSHIFSSVGSTLRKAKSKFIKETQSIIDHDARVHKPTKRLEENRSSLIEAATSKSPSPKKQVASQELFSAMNNLVIPKPATKIPDSQTLTHETKTYSAPQLDSPPNEESTFDDEDKPESFKFSPVSSIYGPLRREMNSTSPTKQKDESTSYKPVSLARKSLSKPNEDRDTKRKSSYARGGLTGLSLEPKQNKISKPRSFSNEQNKPSLKRKTQTEEEALASTKNQAYRKIGTKIVPPSINQFKQTSTQDPKHRRAADQVHNVLNKRASRVSTGSTVHSMHPEEKQEQKPKTAQPKQTHVISSQALMKAAVLQHARLNNDSNRPNPFQTSGGMGISSSINKCPTTPATPTVLPEIFSESDDDEEGSVLKDWANSPELRSILLKQQYVDPDKVFGPIAPLQMEEIFKNSNTRLSRLKHRGSSAQWTGKDALTFQEVENYKKKFKK